MVAQALLPAASTLVSTLGPLSKNARPEESGRGRHECPRHAILLRKILPFSLPVVTSLACAVGMLAQPSAGTISGKIIDARGSEPLSRVQVRLSGTELKAVSANDGSFQISNAPPGDYVLHVSTVGYHLLRIPFSLASGENKSFDLLLTSSNSKRTDTVEVKADAFDLARQESASALTLEGNEQKNLASVLADDPLRAVQSLPGVTANNDFSSEFSLRGAGFERIGIYVDGILLHNPFHMVSGQASHGSLTLFNGDIIDEMTLFEGAWPVRYSDRSAGMLAVNTREGNRQQIHMHVSASASNFEVLADGPLGKNKRGSWLVVFRKSYLQYILNRINFGADEPALSFGFTDGQARLSYDLTPKHNINFSMMDGYSAVDRTAGRAQIGINSPMLSGYRFTMLNLASRYTPSEKLIVTNRFAWTRERGDVENRDLSRLYGDAYGEWIWHTDGSYVWGKSSRLDFGGVFRRMREDGFSNRYTFIPASVQSLDKFRGTAQRSGAYAQQSFSLWSGKVHFTAGSRWDRHSVSVADVASPYASLAFQPFAATKIQFDFGQYAQFPELNQYFSLFGRPALLPMRATHYEGVIEQRLDKRTRLRVEFYNRQDRDLLARPEFDPRVLITGKIFNPPVNAPILNSQRGYARGAQIFLQRSTANGLTGWISYAYGHAQVRDGDLRLSFPSEWDQKHTLNIAGSYRLRPTVNLTAKWSYGSGFPIPGFYRLAANGTSYFLSPIRDALRVTEYQRADLRVNKAFVYQKRKLTLFAEVVNLFNRQNRIFDSAGSYNATTGAASLSFINMFPVLPSAGILFEF